MIRAALSCFYWTVGLVFGLVVVGIVGVGIGIVMAEIVLRVLAL